MADLSKQFVASQIKSLYDECELAQHRQAEADVAEAIELYYNDLRRSIKDHYERTVSGRSKLVETHLREVDSPEAKVQTIKLGCLTLAHILGMDTTQFREPPEGASFVNVNQRMNVSQNTQIDISHIIDFVNELGMAENEREEIERLLAEFEQELGSENTDESVLSQTIEQVKQEYPQVAGKMAVHAIKQGFFDIIGV